MGDSDEQDVAWLLAWRLGDAKSGSRLFEKYGPLIDRFFASKVPDAAEDLLQRTFLALTEKRDSIPAGVAFKPYLLGIARKQLLMHLRRGVYDRARFDPGAYSMIDAGARPSTVLGQKAERRLLAEAILRLPIDYQIAVELHYWKAATLREIAVVTETTPDAVKMRLYRARELLKKHIADLTDDEEVRASVQGSLSKWLAGLPAAVAKPRG